MERSAWSMVIEIVFHFRLYCLDSIDSWYTTVQTKV